MQLLGCGCSFVCLHLLRQSSYDSLRGLLISLLFRKCKDIIPELLYLQLQQHHLPLVDPVQLVQVELLSQHHDLFVQQLNSLMILWNLPCMLSFQQDNLLWPRGQGEVLPILRHVRLNSKMELLLFLHTYK